MDLETSSYSEGLTSTFTATRAESMSQVTERLQSEGDESPSSTVTVARVYDEATSARRSYRPEILPGQSATCSLPPSSSNCQLTEDLILEGFHQSGRRGGPHEQQIDNSLSSLEHHGLFLEPSPDGEDRYPGGPCSSEVGWHPQRECSTYATYCRVGTSSPDHQALPESRLTSVWANVFCRSHCRPNTTVLFPLAFFLLAMGVLVCGFTLRSQQYWRKGDKKLTLVYVGASMVLFAGSLVVVVACVLRRTRSLPATLVFLLVFSLAGTSSLMMWTAHTVKIHKNRYSINSIANCSETKDIPEELCRCLQDLRLVTPSPPIVFSGEEGAAKGEHHNIRSSCQEKLNSAKYILNGLHVVFLVGAAPAVLCCLYFCQVLIMVTFKSINQSDECATEERTLEEALQNLVLGGSNASFSEVVNWCAFIELPPRYSWSADISDPDPPSPLCETEPNSQRTDVGNRCSVLVETNGLLPSSQEDEAVSECLRTAQSPPPPYAQQLSPTADISDSNPSNIINIRTNENSVSPPPPYEG